MREKENGNFQENLKIPKIRAYRITRANLKPSQKSLDLGKFLSHPNRSVEECCYMKGSVSGVVVTGLKKRKLLLKVRY